MTHIYAERILSTRRDLLASLPAEIANRTRTPDAAEGGCGVLGLASQTPIAGRHVLTASQQMHNRGNGKGGGIAMAGLDPAQMQVDAETLRTHYLVQVALLDPTVRGQVEQQFIAPHFDIAQCYEIDHLDDYRAIPGLEVCPPNVWRYFVRVRPDVLSRFIEQHNLDDLPARAVEDEFVYQNSFRLNTAFYASLGDKKAFVLCHGRDLIVLKLVGYAEDVVAYYRLEDQTARVWIAHQRYPTKGRVWHPGGAHPFIGMNEALVHNGDFANYHAVCEYLRQRNMVPLFLTDTEVSALLFDLWDRVYRYPLEVTLEAMAPTTEHDFIMLSPDKQNLYRAIQATHIHGSPDGPWFFILARSHPDEGRVDLLGITDTSMLRPQVFALYENSAPGIEPVRIGLIASERQAINACLRSLAIDDSRFQPVADKYWVARGGSHTDGGAFLLSVSATGGLMCTNKFGQEVEVDSTRRHVSRSSLNPATASDQFCQAWQAGIYQAFDNGGAPSFGAWASPVLRDANWHEVAWGLHRLTEFGREGDGEWFFAWETLTHLRNHPSDPGSKRRASLLALIDEALLALFNAVPQDDNGSHLRQVHRLTRDTTNFLRAPAPDETTLVLDTLGFSPEGDQCAARWIVQACQIGWQHIIAYNWRGGRFAGCGLGTDSYGLRLDLYGDIGDYAASGLDGAEIYIHGDGQDQLGQIMRRGKLVVHGDVGQTFLYGAKGGEVYVRGSAAGRPLINAVGSPRAVINGTCLDYLAESFMAGDPLNGGGFVILNGVTFGEDGSLRDLSTPYPGGNLFSLASGGAIYLRDPHHRVASDQLNGGTFAPVTDADWMLIEPYLRENERLFGIGVDDLLTIDGVQCAPHQVYRKIKVQEANAVLVEHETGHATSR